MTTEKLILEFDAKATKLTQELDKVNAKLDKNNDKTDQAKNKNDKLNVTFRGLAGAASFAAKTIGVATAALVAYATVQGRAIRETEVMANVAGLSVDEFRQMSFVMGTVGITAEKFGDIMKDTQERIGDFLATGGGPFQDYADVMALTKDEAISLAEEFKTMSGQEVLQAMVTRMNDAGKSTQEMSFALEGMASDATRLIPLLKENGKQAKALGEQFTKIDSPLTDEEREQFKELATNVELARSSFTNFLNNAIAPFLPAINKATQALAEFFATAKRDTDIDNIIDNNELIKEVDTITELNELEKRSNELILEKKKNLAALSRGRADETGFGKAIARDEIAALEKVIELTKQQRAEVEKNIAEKEKNLDLEASKGNLSGDAVSGTTGADTITGKEGLQKELEALQDAKMTRLQSLREEREERLEILKTFNEQELEQLGGLEAAKQQIENDFRLQVLEATETDAEKRQEDYANQLAELREFKEAGLIEEQAYLERLNEIIGEFAPSILNPELLEEENQKELERLKEQLKNKEILHREYYEKIAQLEKKDLKDKGKMKETEVKWSESATKQQLDDGMKFLSALGTNSKKAHKIKQGLAAGNTIMQTAENVVKAGFDPFKVTYAIATGAAQLATIYSSTPDGGGSAPSAGAIPTESAEESPVQETTITDISGGGQSSSQMLVLDFGDEIVDTIARKIEAKNTSGR